MTMLKGVTIWSNPETRDRLAQVAEANKRSMSKQLDVMVYREWMKLFGNMPGMEVVDVDELPGPDDAKSVPVLHVQPIQE